LPISFYYKKKKEITAGLIRENKITGIACRVAASSNNSIQTTAFSGRRYAPPLMLSVMEIMTI